MASRTVHDFPRRMARLWERVEQADIPQENKRLLREFDRHCVAAGLSLPRRVKLTETVYLFGMRYFSGPFRGASPDAILDGVVAIESSSLALWTKRDYKTAVKKFFKFVEWGADALRRPGYPDSVAGISVAVRKKDRVRIHASDILTIEEVERLIAAATDSQDRAFITLLYELGARIDEIGPMAIRDIVRDQYSFICDLDGKTGRRSQRVVLAAASVANWLNVHPKRDDPAAFLWGCAKGGEWKGPTYAGLRARVRSLARKAGITKRVHPHLFRHARITHLLASGHMNEAQIKKYCGLAADSDVIATYAHLVSKDANDAVLKMYGITPEDATPGLAPQRCNMCSEFNEKASRFCRRCGYALSLSAPDDVMARVGAAEDRISRFLKQPEIEDAFRQMVREEIETVLAHALPRRSARSPAPTGG